MVWGEQRGGLEGWGAGQCLGQGRPTVILWSAVSGDSSGWWEGQVPEGEASSVEAHFKIGPSAWTRGRPLPVGRFLCFWRGARSPRPTPRGEQCRSASGRAPQCAWLRRALRWPQVPRGAAPGRGAGRAGPAGRAPRPARAPPRPPRRPAQGPPGAILKVTLGWAAAGRRAEARRARGNHDRR